MSQGVYSTLTPLLLSDNDARMQSLVGTKWLWLKWTAFGQEMQVLGAENACNIDLHTRINTLFSGQRQQKKRKIDNR
uniref:Uncharacterized protein MANES_02G069700 n=1 Tax=Rhizophora mucronata TaxID=61149 RepID=A0A2P2L5M2_RHIMU